MKNKLYSAILFCLSILHTGCVTPSNVNESMLAKDKARYLSAGSIGCLPSEIEVEFVEPKWNKSAVWTAKCKSSIYICSSYGLETSPVNCSLAAK